MPLKYTGNNMKIRDTFDHNFRNIFWPRYHSKGIILYHYDGALTLKKRRLTHFAMKLLICIIHIIHRVDKADVH